MALTTVHATEQVTQWSSDVLKEFVKFNEFSMFSGTGSNNIIVFNENLTRQRGAKVTINLIARLQGAGRTGNQTLEGFEEDAKNYGHLIECSTLRNAVAVDEEDADKAPFDLLQEYREPIMDWRMETHRDRIILALSQVSVSGTLNVNRVDASEANKDTWQTNNSDRVLYGAVNSNASGDDSADLAKVDNTADKLTVSSLGVLKRKAETADPRIRPYRVRERSNELWYVCFTGVEAFRDLKQDIRAGSATEDNFGSYYNRGSRHPLIADTDLVVDGVIVRKVQSLTAAACGTDGTGASSIDVMPAFMCGLQTVGHGFKRRPFPIQNSRDYGFVNGIGISESSGTEKMLTDFGTLKDHGVATGFFAGVGDS